MRSGLGGTLVLSVALLLARSTQAREIRDGAEFSVRLPEGADVCFVFPASRFDPAACPAGVQPVDDMPLGEHAKVLAVGAVATGTPWPWSSTTFVTASRRT